MLDPNSRTQTTEYKHMYSSVVVCSYALNCCMALCKIAPFTPNSHLLRYNNQTMELRVRDWVRYQVKKCMRLRAHIRNM